ncbi:MAG: hypothetical protein CVV45_00660 [Spirochaetae bacterium HGW-Spirochaetae-10]|nr:MAG: hypothetical protein CVV45_00660 [Spirochaetae bacterium HGW-Spirochaetae-10]
MSADIDLEPCLRIFLSVDIVGSTAYKQQDPRPSSQAWVNLFKDFFTDFPLLFTTKYKTAFKAISPSGESDPNTPAVWKGLGDEILFHKKLGKSAEAMITVDAFIEAIEEYRHAFTGKHLDLKGSAWIAGFPVNNIRLQIADYEDFIGPSIDIGFRISKFATPSRFVLSCDLATILLDGGTSRDYLFTGTERLKGVFGDDEYPIIFMRMGDQANDVEGLIPSVATSRLKSYCDDFCTSASYPLIFPFITGDQKFWKQPQDYTSRLDSLKLMLRADVKSDTEPRTAAAEES